MRRKARYKKRMDKFQSTPREETGRLLTQILPRTSCEDCFRISTKVGKEGRSIKRRKKVLNTESASGGDRQAQLVRAKHLKGRERLLAGNAPNGVKKGRAQTTAIWERELGGGDTLPRPLPCDHLKTKRVIRGGDSSNVHAKKTQSKLSIVGKRVRGLGTCRKAAVS